MSLTTPSRATLADLAAAVRAAPMADRRRQDIVSAVNTIARMLGRSPAEIPLELRALNARLKHVSPRAFGITTARWHNVRSLFRSALALMGPVMKGRNVEPMSDAWASLHNLIPVRGDKIKLGRLMRWLSAQRITPESVVEEDLARFHRSLCAESLLRDPEGTWTDTTLAWNRAFARVPHWPELRINRQTRRQSYVLPWSAFPDSLKRDVDAWLARLAGRDFAEDGPTRPLRSSTVSAREYHLRAFASALVLRGRDPKSLVSLTACLTVDNFIEGLRFFHDRFGKRPSATTSNLAAMLKSIAKHWVKASDADLHRMLEITRKLTVKYAGLTQKNRDRLRPFNDLKNCQKLLALPFTLQQAVETGKLPAHRRRVHAQVAVAVELLIFAPIRLKNLAALEIDRHFVKVGKKLMLNIPAAEVKNGVDLDFELPDQSAELIRWYLKDVRTAEPGNLALFPTASGSHKDRNTLALQIAQTVQRYTGFAVNPHLFRHIGAQIYLGLNPGGYEVMRRVLGHKKMDTTSNFYAGLETLSAARHFDQEILKLRSETQARKRP